MTARACPPAPAYGDPISARGGTRGQPASPIWRLRLRLGGLRQSHRAGVSPRAWSLQLQCSSPTVWSGLCASQKARRRQLRRCSLCAAGGRLQASSDVVALLSRRAALGSPKLMTRCDAGAALVTSHWPACLGRASTAHGRYSSAVWRADARPRATAVVGHLRRDGRCVRAQRSVAPYAMAGCPGLLLGCDMTPSQRSNGAQGPRTRSRTRRPPTADLTKKLQPSTILPNNLTSGARNPYLSHSCIKPT